LMWAREEAASRSGGPAELTHHTSERSQAALEHTPRTPDIRQKGWQFALSGYSGFPSVWRARGGARRLSSRARGAARAPRRALFLSDNQVVWFRGESAPTLPISEVPGPPRKAQVLLVPTAAAASFLYSPDRKRHACGH